MTEYGFLDSVNVRDGIVTQTLLSLDQGMVLGALGNVLADGILRRTFTTPDVEAMLQPLVERERFGVGRDEDE